MKTDTPPAVYLKDYTPPAWLVDTVDLDFVIAAGATTVTATLAMRRNPAVAAQPLVLDGWAWWRRRSARAPRRSRVICAPPWSA